MPALLLNASSRPYISLLKNGIRELIYSDHLMLFTDQHSLGPKTTERVRVAEMGVQTTIILLSHAVCDQSLVCLGDTRILFTDNISTVTVRVWFLFKAFLVQQKNKATRRNRMSNRIDLRLAFGKWRHSRKRRVRGQSAPEKPPNSCHSTRHLAFATLLHDIMVIVGRPITLGV